jgi:hypothetical protein
MKFRNPWVDPRVCQVQPEQVRRYLEHHGWKLTGPANDPNLIRYDVADNDEKAPTLFLPVRVDTGPGLQWMIELIGELAMCQDRYVGDVLTDILSQTETTVGNGISTDQARGVEITTK